MKRKARVAFCGAKESNTAVEYRTTPSVYQRHYFPLGLRVSLGHVDL